MEDISIYFIHCAFLIPRSMLGRKYVQWINEYIEISAEGGPMAIWYTHKISLDIEHSSMCGKCWEVCNVMSQCMYFWKKWAQKCEGQETTRLEGYSFSAKRSWNRRHLWYTWLWRERRKQVVEIQGHKAQLNKSKATPPPQHYQLMTLQCNLI